MSPCTWAREGLFGWAALHSYSQMSPSPLVGFLHNSAVQGSLGLPGQCYGLLWFLYSRCGVVRRHVLRIDILKKWQPWEEVKYCVT